MKTKPRTGRGGFTLIEILAVIAIIGILAAILVPVAGHARQAALKRRAMVEMNSIKMAVLQFHQEHGYMPWPPTTVAGRQIWVGEDMWTVGDADQLEVIKILTGDNTLKKTYLQIPEKSRASADSLVFVDPWKQPYRIGLDRDLDNAILPDATIGGDYVKEQALVYSLGDPADDPRQVMKTW